MRYEAIVIGSSAGGLYALTSILSKLPVDFPVPVIIVQHRSKEEPSLLEEVLSHKCKIAIKQADEKEAIRAATVYFAPADYHLLIEHDYTFSLSFDPPVNYSRPSIDVLFETAASVFKNKLLAVILTGASKDGAEGIKRIKKCGGITVAQDPASAQYPFMPQAAIDTGDARYIFNLDKISDFLLSINTNS